MLLPTPVIIADAKKCLLTGAIYGCLLSGSARALLIQMRMVAANHWTEQGNPNGGVREKSEGAERVCNTIGRITISTNQSPPEVPRTNHQPMSTHGVHMTPGTYVAEDAFLSLTS